MGTSGATAIEKPAGGIPVALNLCLAFFHTAVNLFQFVILPLWLLPKDVRWGWTLALLAMLTNPFWSLLHEAIHDLFHPNRTVNALAARLLAVLFGAPFRILRLSHLLHHKLNRLPVEGTEYYDKTKSSKAGAAPGYYFQILLGLYLAEVLSPLFFLLPRPWLKRFKERFLAPQSVSGILMQNWLGADALREIRIDGMLTLALFSFSFYCYGEHWPLLLAVLAARGFLISFLDNVYHYETPVGDVFYARNLRLNGALERLLLHFNLHGIHHLNPAIPWSDLPRAFLAQAGKFEGGYFSAALRQLRGPIALQDLPGGAAKEKIHPA
ncbi:MAG: fatty acid desaturase [Deltaproteobacteria bacterium]|nr:fatty acid desaturase [Deltaproteobacteria bacterium]MDZ4345686.1 fatty acid desaturase [Candidatus Binatia bacterium]